MKLAVQQPCTRPVSDCNKVQLAAEFMALTILIPAVNNRY